MENQKILLISLDIYYVEYPDRLWVHYVLLRDEDHRHIAIFLSENLYEFSRAVLGKTTVPPLTSDAMLACITSLDARVEEAFIYDVADETYRSRVTLRAGERTTDVEMRPSDAVSLAVRAGCPIYISEHVLAVAAEQYRQCCEDWRQQGLHIISKTESHVMLPSSK